MNWVVDKGLDKLLAQIDAACPDRSKASDGSIGDAAHQTRESDHNPQHPAPPGNPDYQVDARDFTQDPAHGADMAIVSEAIRTSHDERVKYVIFARRIFYGADYRVRFVWQPYDGTDPHTNHMHVSVRDATHDQTQPWSIGLGLGPFPRPPVEVDMPLTQDDLDRIVAAVTPAVAAAVWHGDIDSGSRTISGGTALLGILDRPAAVVDTAAIAQAAHDGAQAGAAAALAHVTATTTITAGQ